jgi:hypothetical protein
VRRRNEKTSIPDRRGGSDAPVTGARPWPDPTKSHRHNRGRRRNDIDATRQLVLGAEGGPTIDEVLYKYSAEKMSYSYRITAVKVEVLPVTNYSSHLTVKPRDGGGALVEWRGAFYRGYPNNDPPEELNDAAAIAAVTGVYPAGLDALVERFGAPGS